MTIEWTSVYQLDTTGMSPEYAARIRSSLDVLQASAIGQQLLRDLEASSQGNKTVLRLANKDDPGYGSFIGANDGFNVRGAYYDSDNRTIHLNPGLMKSPLYQSVEQTVHLFIHESDHAVRHEDVVRIDTVPTIGELYALRDSMETSAQRRANNYYAEIGRAPQIYSDAFGEGYSREQRMLCKPSTTQLDSDGSLTAQNASRVVMGTGTLAAFEGDYAGLAKFLSDFGCGRVPPDTILQYLQKNPRDEQSTPEVKPPALPTDQAGMAQGKAKDEEPVLRR